MVPALVPALTALASLASLPPVGRSAARAPGAGLARTVRSLIAGRRAGRPPDARLLPPPAGPLVPAPLPDTFPAALIGLGASIAPETAQARTPKMDRLMSSAKNRRRQYVAADPFPRRLLIVLSPIR
jgi:hypothetical protein